MFLLLLCILPLASGHGGMMWPPSWWDGQKVPLEEINSWSGDVPSDPPVKDPASGKLVVDIRSWLTDQVYLEGIGKKYLNKGNVTNPECLEERCGWRKTSWASPGHARSLGGGCGIFGGNPNGCDEDDTRPPGSECVGRSVFSGGSSALDLDFPDAANTEMEAGSWQDVAWLSNGAHFGGYTYRLCKLPPGGKKDIKEECFAKNVLKFATNYTMMRYGGKPGDWFKVEQNDLTQGTNPPGSAWRHVGLTNGDNSFYIRKDTVIIPEDLPEGDYVLGFRWDTEDPQIWVSCANVRLTPPRR
jgi:hypothetical protein